MARQHGRTGLIELAGPTNVPIVVSFISAWTFNATKEKVDVTGMSDAQITMVVGLPAYGGTFDFFWDDSLITIQNAAAYQATNGIAYTVCIYPDGQLASARSIVGPAWIDYELSGGVKDAVKGKANFVAAPGTAWAVA